MNSGRSLGKRPLRIGLNLLYLIPGEVGGVETYARSLLEALSRQDQETEYTVYVSRSARHLPLPETGNFRRVVVPINARNRYLRYLWEQTLLPVQAGIARLDLLHSLNYVGPLLAPCPTAVTIHDVNHISVGKDMGLVRRFFLGTVSTLSARRSTCVIAVSSFSKNEICEKLIVPSTRVRMIHSGHGWNHESESPVTGSSVRKKYKLEKPYLIAFAGGYPHKNIPRLLRAFDTHFQDLPHELALIGRLSDEVNVQATVSPAMAGRIRLLGYLPTGDIPMVLGQSDLFVFPSLYEGFGFPVLEAQLARVAVACSQVAALPEIAGDAAVLFDPNSESSMGQTIRETTLNPELRHKLIAAGTANVRRFSWAKSAEEYLKTYRDLCITNLN